MAKQGRPTPRSTEASPTTLFLGMLLVLFAAAWLLYGGAARAPRELPSRNAAATPSGQDTGSPMRRPDAVEAMIAKQRRDRETLIRALEKVAAGDPRGDALIAFHREHAYYSVLVGGGVTKALFQSAEEVRRAESPFAFEITIASREVRARNGLHVAAAFQWDSARNELFLPDPAAISELWAGALFAHELSHAHDIVTGGEPRGLPTQDPRFLAGELHAYELEIRLVDRAMNEAYLAAVRDLERRLAPTVGDAPWVTLDQAETGAKKLDAIFPPARSDEEQSARYGTTYMALNFAHIDARGGTERDKLRFIASTFGIDLPK